MRQEGFENDRTSVGKMIKSRAKKLLTSKLSETKKQQSIENNEILNFNKMFL